MRVKHFVFSKKVVPFERIILYSYIQFVVQTTMKGNGGLDELQE